MVRFVPRGRSELRRLLDVGDLDHAVPSTLWDRVDERTWRTGIVGGEQLPSQAAARAAGSITAWRSYSSEDGRWLWIQVVPLAAASDAAEALTAAADPARGRRNTRAEVTLTGRTDLDHPPVVAGAELTSATLETTAPDGVVLTLRATAGAFLVVAVGSGPGWEWAELVDVVAAQVARLTM